MIRGIRVDYHSFSRKKFIGILIRVFPIIRNAKKNGHHIERCPFCRHFDDFLRKDIRLFCKACGRKHMLNRREKTN